MERFFFPCLWLIPEFASDTVETTNFVVHKRKWDVSIFDLYSLVAEKHALTFPAELMHLFLQKVNLEIETKAAVYSEAADSANCFRAMLYLQGVTPIIMPFASNFSLNSYAGINDRSSGQQANKHAGPTEGITHSTARVHTWPHELTFTCVHGPVEASTLNLSAELIANAARDYDEWRQLEEKFKHLKAARRLLVNAPLMPDMSTSILQLWQGIESLFPSVSTEITFRVSLLLAELSSPVTVRADTYKQSKLSYVDRSRIVHGVQKNMDGTNWHRAWKLLCDALRAVLARKSLPDEDALILEVLSRRG